MLRRFRYVLRSPAPLLRTVDCPSGGGSDHLNDARISNNSGSRPRRQHDGDRIVRRQHIGISGTEMGAVHESGEDRTARFAL